jgi:hypothetical protein
LRSIAETEVLDQGESIIGQYVRGIGGGIVRLRTVSVATEVRKNDAMPLFDEHASPAVEHLRT